MDKKNNKPQIRFIGFTDPWEQRKLCNLGEVITGNTPRTANQEYYNGDFSFVSPADIQGNRFIDNTITTLTKKGFNQGRKICKGSSLFVSIGSTIGKVAQANRELITNQQINSVVPYLDNNNNFVFTLLEVVSPQIRKIAATQAVPIVNKSTFSEHKILAPTINEQKQIGDYYKKLDNLITLHQRKLDKLKIIKKSLLEKMFPKTGKTIPEIRFKNFTEPWEQRKFSDNIISIQTGTNKLGLTSNKGTPLLKMGNIQRGFFSLEKIEYLDENQNVEKENIAYYGDFFFNTRNTLELVGKGATWTGENGKYAFNSNIARFVFKDIDTIFFNYLYNTENMIRQIHGRAMGTTSVAAIYPRTLNSLVYKLPSQENQKQVGLLFQKIDNLITLHQRQLEKLKNIKKSLLDKMFV